jgi:copper(I)-binding protein
MAMLPRLTVCLLLAACAGEQGPPLAIEGIEVTQPGTRMSAGYLTLSNATGEPIVITRVSSPQYARVELHETTVVDSVSRMRPLDELTVPARGSVTLERGGKHLMLMGPVDPLDRIELNFHSVDAVLLTATVETN